MELSTALIYYAVLVLIIYVVLVYCGVMWYAALMMALTVGLIFLLSLFPPNRLMSFTSSNAGMAYAVIFVITIILIIFYVFITGLRTRCSSYSSYTSDV